MFHIDGFHGIKQEQGVTGVHRVTEHFTPHCMSNSIKGISTFSVLLFVIECNENGFIMFCN